MERDNTLLILVAVLVVALAICVGMYYFDDTAEKGTDSFYDMEVGDYADYSIDTIDGNERYAAVIHVEMTGDDAYILEIRGDFTIDTTFYTQDEFNNMLDEGYTFYAGDKKQTLALQDIVTPHNKNAGDKKITYTTPYGDRFASEYSYDDDYSSGHAVGEMAFGALGALYYDHNVIDNYVEITIVLTETNMNL